MAHPESGSDDLVQILAWAVRFPMMLIVTMVALAAFLLMDLYFWLDGPAHSGARSRAIGLSAACASVGGVIPAVGTFVRIVEKKHLTNQWSVTPRKARIARIAANVIVLLIVSAGVFAVSIIFGARFAVPLMAILFLPEFLLARELSAKRID